MHLLSPQHLTGMQLTPSEEDTYGTGIRYLLEVSTTNRWAVDAGTAAIEVPASALKAC